MIYVLALIYFSIGIACTAFVGRISLKPLMIGASFLLLICIFSVLNTTYGMIDEKVASFLSYDAYKNNRFNLTFFVQYLITWIPNALLDFQYTAHSLNIGLQAFIFFLAAQYLFKTSNTKWQLLALLIFPSYYHYAIFGLRDPLIALTTLIIVIGAIRLSSARFVYLCLILSVINIGIRPEFSLIIVGFGVLRLFFLASRRTKYVIAVAAVCALYGALLLMPLAFGIQNTGTVNGNIENMVLFNELRNERRLGGDGGGSHILGGNLFQYPMIVRYPIQLASSFIAPLPFEIKGALGYLAFAESLLFAFVAVMAFRMAKLNSTSLFLFCCGFGFMALQAFFAINYGNILRIRYPAFIFFLAATLPLEYKYSRPKLRKSRNMRRKNLQPQ